MAGTRHHTGMERTNGWGRWMLFSGLILVQSLGWEHYEVHEPEPHILLFKFVASSSVRCCQATNRLNRRPINYHPPAVAQ